MVLLMTVEPGFGGQSFIDHVLPKIRRTRQLLTDRDSAVWVQVDGGVSAATVERAAEAGADVFVAGSAVFGASRPGTGGPRAPGTGDRGRRTRRCGRLTPRISTLRDRCKSEPAVKSATRPKPSAG